MQVAAFPDLKVLDLAGKSVNLVELAKDRTLIITFLRHFGCLHCLETVAQLRSKLDRVKEAGAELILVGNGTPEQAAAFQAARAPELQVFTDPAQTSYRALHLKRGVASTLSLGSFWRGLLATIHGYRQTSIQGDPWQQGGLFVILKGGKIVYSQINRHAGDRPNLEAALATVKSAQNNQLC